MSILKFTSQVKKVKNSARFEEFLADRAKRLSQTEEEIAQAKSERQRFI